MNINKHLDDVFTDIVNIAKSYDNDKKKLQLNNKFLQKVKEWAERFEKAKVECLYPADAEEAAK